MKRKEENVLNEALSSMKYLVRHRGGVQIPILNKTLDTLRIGKKIIHIDNHIPALIEDAFFNLGYEQKDGTKPVIAAKRKTQYGWHLVWQLPPGVSFGKVKGDKDTLQDSCNAWIELLWRAGKCHMDVYCGSLPEKAVPFEWDPAPYLNKMNLPIPIGIYQCGLEVVDLAVIPHLLIGGATNWGKSNFLHSLIASLLMLQVIIVVIDHKRLDFGYLSGLCLLSKRERETLAILEALNNEMERRFDILEAANVVKIQEYPGNDLPYIIVIIDELAECNSDEVMYYIDRLARLARAVGIHLVGATQRPSTKVINGDTRSNFPGRLCFQMSDEVSSRVILGENCSAAAWLPAIQGRAIFKFGLAEREIQTMHLPHKKAKELAAGIKGRTIGGWEAHVKPDRPSRDKPEVKRLAPR